MSWKLLRSLPSKNTASGLTPSTVRNSLADLPMRCVSITSWPAAEISGTVAFCCILSEATVSAISSRSEDWRLMVRSAVPTWVRICFWSSTTLALLSARLTSGSIFCISPSYCAPTRARPSDSSPPARPRTWRSRSSALSLTSSKAAGVPTSACDTDLARRCDCISDWPVAATGCATRSACRMAEPAVSSSSSTSTASTIDSRRCWRAERVTGGTGTGATGEPPSADAAGASASSRLGRSSTGASTTGAGAGAGTAASRGM